MSQYILRLDDASDYMDITNWQRMEDLLDKYNVKPLVGIIPDNRDDSLVGLYPQNIEFWDKVLQWKEKGWELAMHGCYHRYTTENGGINPVNNRSEFAGVTLEKQRGMIRHGVDVLRSHDIEPHIFFAPSHTFDENTLLALKKESEIRIISDTVANDVYYWNGFYFVPQQSGRTRNLPFRVCTFCYHPNTMKDSDFERLELFLRLYVSNFVSFSDVKMKKRKRSFLDRMLRGAYFIKRR